jgi:hypothetical protein
MNTSHSPFFSQPEKLVEILLDSVAVESLGFKV